MVDKVRVCINIITLVKVKGEEDLIVTNHNHINQGEEEGDIMEVGVVGVDFDPQWVVPRRSTLPTARPVMARVGVGLVLWVDPLPI